MKTVLIIEADLKIVTEIKTNLEALDPKLQILDFQEIAKFEEWREAYFKLLAESKNAKPIDPALVIGSWDLLGPKKQNIAIDIKSKFVEKGLRTQDNPTNVILLAFETPDFNPRKVDSSVYNNIILMPFDKPILMQHLRVGLSGIDAIKDTTVFKQKVTTKIEMLKDANLVNISEIGFSTKSSRPVNLGKTSKYYSPYFGGGSTRSVYARCIGCVSTGDTEHTLDFEYVGLATDQFSALRKMLIPQGYKGMGKLAPAVKKVDLGGVNFVIINNEKNEDKELHETLEKRYSNCKGYSFAHPDEFFSLLDADLIESKVDIKKSVFAKGNPAKLFFSLTNQLLGFAVEPEAGALVLGYPISTALEAGFLEKNVHADDLMRLKKIFASEVPKVATEATVVLRLTCGKWHAWEFQSKNLIQHEKHGRCIEYTIRELSEVEARLFVQRKQSLKYAIHALMISSSYATGDFKKKLPDVIKRIVAHNEKLNEKTQPKVLLIASKQILEEEKSELFDLFSDVIYEPLDRTYLIKRFHAWFPRLMSKEDAVEIVKKETTELISIANPTELLDISEAGLTVKYHRAISPGSIRRFSIGVKGGESIELLANCHHTEPLGEIHLNQFVFFAVTDKTLKHIRKWIVENYVLTKQSE